MRRLALAFFYDKDGRVDDYMIFLMRELETFVERTLFISNGPLQKDSEIAVRTVTQEVLIRENEGFDVGAYKAGLEYLGFGNVAKYDELILYNHTFYGPIFPFSEMFHAMERKDCDFWGITAHKEIQPNPFTGKGILPFHLNSHFIAIRHGMVLSKHFEDYWKELPKIESYQDSILRHESRFTDHFKHLGFRVSTYIDCADYTSNYPLFDEVDQVLANRCPILKRRSLFADPIMMDQLAVDLPRALRIVEENSSYDMDLIWANILRGTELRVLHTNAGLMSIIPHAVTEPEQSFKGRIAVCAHIFYVDLIDELLAKCCNIPYPFDFIATTDTDEKRKVIEAELQKQTRVTKFIVRVVQENKGADTSALLITCRDILTSARYDVVLRIHSKKSPQDIGGRGRYFKRHIFENLLDSPRYVENVLAMFEKQPRMGLAIPPVIHVYYPVMGNGWFTNRQRAEKVAAMLDLHVKFDQDTPIAPYGGMFWFRPEALRKLLEYNWQWSDFEDRYGDGDLPHAIERLYAYVAQDAGFLTQTIATARQAAQSYVRLEYKVQKLASLIPPGDFGHNCYLLSRWKEAGHYLPQASVADRIDDHAANRHHSFTALAGVSAAVRHSVDREIGVSRFEKSYFRVSMIKNLWRRDAIDTHIDAINGLPNPGAAIIAFRRDSTRTLTIEGWAVPRESQRPFDAVVVRLTGGDGPLARLAEPIERPDVVQHFGRDNWLRCGFICQFRLGEVPRGTYNVGIVGIEGDGGRRCRVKVATIVLE